MKTSVLLIKRHSIQFVLSTLIALTCTQNVWALDTNELIRALRERKAGVPRGMGAAKDKDLYDALDAYLISDQAFQKEDKDMKFLQKELERLKRKRETGQNEKGNALNRRIFKSSTQKENDAKIENLERQIEQKEKNVSSYYKTRRENRAALDKLEDAIAKVENKFDGDPDGLERELKAQFKALTGKDYTDPAAPAAPAPVVPAPAAPVVAGGSGGGAPAAPVPAAPVVGAPAPVVPVPGAPAAAKPAKAPSTYQIAGKPNATSVAQTGAYLDDNYVKILQQVVTDNRDQRAVDAAQKALDFHNTNKAAGSVDPKAGSLMYKMAQVARDIDEYAKDKTKNATVLNDAATRAQRLMQRVDAFGKPGGMPPGAPGAPAPAPGTPGAPAPVPGAPGAPAPAPGAPRAPAAAPGSPEAKLAKLKQEKADAKIREGVWNQQMANSPAAIAKLQADEAKVQREITTLENRKALAELKIKGGTLAPADLLAEKGKVLAFNDQIAEKQAEKDRIAQEKVEKTKSDAGLAAKIAAEKDIVDKYKDKKYQIEAERKLKDGSLDPKAILADKANKAALEARVANGKNVRDTDKLFYNGVVSSPKAKAQEDAIQKADKEIARIKAEIVSKGLDKKATELSDAQKNEKYNLMAEIAGHEADKKAAETELDKVKACFFPAVDTTAVPPSFTDVYYAMVGDKLISGIKFPISGGAGSYLDPTQGIGKLDRLAYGTPEALPFSQARVDHFKDKYLTAAEQSYLAGKAHINLKDLESKLAADTSPTAASIKEKIAALNGTHILCTSYSEVKKYAQIDRDKSKNQHKDDAIRLNALNVLEKLEAQYKDVQAISAFINDPGKVTPINVLGKTLNTKEEAVQYLNDLKNQGRVIEKDGNIIGVKDENGVEFKSGSGH